MRFDESLPEGARIVYRPPPAAKRPEEGLTHAEYLVKSVHPGAEITQVLRDPNSDLGRKNPGSLHIKARSQPGLIPVDVRPIPGMSFDEFVGGFEKKGLRIIQARDEVTNPSSHATGPHWHVVLDDMEGLPAGARIKKLGTAASPAPVPAQAPGSPEYALAAARAAEDAEALWGGGPSALPDVGRLTPPPGAPAPETHRRGLPQGFDAGTFKARVGAIASDRSKPVEERFNAIRALSQEAGLSISETDLWNVAENGLALIELQDMGNGQAGLNTLRAAPPRAPTKEQQATGPKLEQDPRLRGLNDLVRKMVNSGEIGKVPALLEQYGVPISPAVLAGVARWRRENGGRPYTGKIDLERHYPDAPAPTAPPPVSAEQATNEAIIKHFGYQELSAAPERAPKDKTTGEIMREIGLAMGKSPGAADRMQREAAYLPIIGGMDAIDQGMREGGVGGATSVVLGGLDVVTAGMGGGAVRQTGRRLVDDLFDAMRGDGVAPEDIAKLGLDPALLERAAAHGDIATPDQLRAYLMANGADIRPLDWPVAAAAVEGEAVAPEAVRRVATGGGGVRPPAGSFPRGSGSGVAGGGPGPSTTVPGGRADVDEPLPEGARIIRRGEGSTPPASDTVSAERVLPDEVVPIPGNRVETPDELPTALGDVEAPRLTGRAPKRPPSFADALKDRMAEESRRKGLPVRIDAEDAITHGVPAELIYKNPDVADRSKLQLRNPSLFGTRYGSMRGTQQELRSLDLDDVGPADWGFDNLAGGGRLEPEDVGDLLRRSLEGDPSALERGSAYDAWAARQEQLDQVAEFEGRYPDGPPVEQRGSPVRAEDLDALTPPLSAYEDAPKLVGKIGNLNLERVEKPEDVTRLVQRIADMVRVDNKALDRVSNTELEALAAELAVTPERILKWKQGALPSPAELYATRVIVHQGRQKLVQLAKRARGASDEDLARFHNMVVAQSQLERQLAGMAAETGRALQQFNMIAKSGDKRDQAIKAYLKSAGDRETVEEMAEKLIDLAEDPAAAGRFIQKADRIRKRDMLSELWINSLLSGPRTHIVNAVSNTFTALWTLPEQALAASIGKALGTEDRALVREVGHRAIGMIQGAREGLALAKQALRTGEPIDEVTKVEARNYRALPNFGRKAKVPDWVPIFGGKETTTLPVGSVIRSPTRALTASDEFFKSVNRRATLNALAYRKAMAGPGTAEERAARFAEFRNNPTPEMVKAADDEARYLTFQKPLGPNGRKVQEIVNDVPGLKLIVPFIRTPANLLKFAGERSVLAPLMPSFRDAIRKGGHTRNEALARVTLGSGLSAAAVVAALDGSISGGGPTDPQERAALKNSGWQEYSIRIGDRWVSYQRFEPLSMLAGIAADFAEVGKFATDEEGESIAMALATSVAKNVTSKTWLSGASDFFDALSDPERYGESFFSKTVSSLAVPAVVAHAAGAMDPDLRDARTLLDKIKQRVPGMSSDIEARRNVWGDEIKKGHSLGPDFLSPVYSTKADDSPLMKEVARLKAPLSMPQRSLNVDGRRVELTPEQYSYYVQLSGKPAKKFFEDAIQSRRWQRMDDDHKREYLKKKLEGFRATARGQLKDMFPELQSAKTAQRVKARVKDGDTIAVDIRLLGTDAFEVKQKCQKPDGTCTACGQGARQFMGQLFEGAEGKRGRDALRMSFTGETTYGRPVATATIGGKDVGEELIRQGWAVAEPKYLQSDPDRLRRYTAAEAEARQSRRGAHAFRFNTPEEYRRGRRLQCESIGTAPGKSEGP